MMPDHDPLRSAQLEHVADVQSRLAHVLAQLAGDALAEHRLDGLLGRAAAR